VTLGAPDGASTVALDRDLVVRWTAASSELMPSLRVGRPGDGRPHAACAYGLLSVVPPAAGREAPAFARDLIVLLDTSGSMSGLPLEQARRVVRRLCRAQSCRFLGEASEGAVEAPSERFSGRGTPSPP
jgi:hypothetical protein